MAGTRQIERGLLPLDRQHPTLAQLQLDALRHLIQAVGLLAGHIACARGTLRVQENRGCTDGHLFLTHRSGDACRARLLLGLRHYIALLTVEDELLGISLHDRRRGSFDAHRKTVAVRQAASHCHPGRERILCNADGLLRLLFVEPRHHVLGG